MVTLETYDAFNSRRYSDPWVGVVDPETAKITFPDVGGYTGGRRTGEAGTLYIRTPVEGTVYAYGQKDYRKNVGGTKYAKYIDGAFVEIPKTELVAVLNRTAQKKGA
jgi:hypothetical protein